jgi:outer membrane autotransporter protein
VQSASANRYGLWADLYGGRGNRDPGDGYDAYDADSSAITVGFDTALSPQWLLGASVGWAGTDVEFDSNYSESELNSTYFSLYGSWISQRSYLDATVFMGRGKQEDTRLVEVVGLTPLVATSEHDVDTTAMSLDGAYNFGKGDWSWGPFGALRYVRIEEDGFVETGAGDLSLRVAGKNSTAFFGDVGVRMWREWSTSSGEVVPEISVSWVHDFDIDDTDVVAGFVGAPGFDFVTPGQSAEKDGIRVSLGLGYVSRRGFSSLIRYSGEFRGDFEWHGLQGQLRYEF